MTWFMVGTTGKSVSFYSLRVVIRSMENLLMTMVTELRLSSKSLGTPLVLIPAERALAAAPRAPSLM